MQRFCPVDHVLIASYAKVKRNPKSAMTAETSNVFLVNIFMFFLFYASVKRNQKSAMTAGKSHVLFVSENFHDFSFLYNVFA